MPELPEVETIARTLRPDLVGMMIVDADVRWPRTVAMPSVRRFKQMIRGQTIREVGRRAKFLRLQLTDLELLIHLRMSGDVSLKRGPLQPAKHDRLILSLEHARRGIGQTPVAGPISLVFNDTRKFGRVWLTADATQITGKLGPEPLSDDFDANAATRAPRRPTSSWTVKATRSSTLAGACLISSIRVATPRRSSRASLQITTPI